MNKKLQKNVAGASLKRRVRQIATELLTANYGHSLAETGDCLVIKKVDGNTERDLGGRCRQSIEMVLLRHLSNHKLCDTCNKE